MSFRLTCQEAKKTIAAYKEWYWPWVPITGSLDHWHASFPHAQAANLSRRANASDIQEYCQHARFPGCEGCPQLPDEAFLGLTQLEILDLRGCSRYSGGLDNAALRGRTLAGLPNLKKLYVDRRLTEYFRTAVLALPPSVELMYDSTQCNDCWMYQVQPFTLMQWCECCHHDDESDPVQEVCDHCMRTGTCDYCHRFECERCADEAKDMALLTFDCQNGCGLRVCSYCGLTCKYCGEHWCDEKAATGRPQKGRAKTICDYPFGYFCLHCKPSPQQPTKPLYICCDCYDQCKGICSGCHKPFYDPCDNECDEALPE